MVGESNTWVSTRHAKALETVQKSLWICQSGSETGVVPSANGGMTVNGLPPARRSSQVVEAFGGPALVRGDVSDGVTVGLYDFAKAVPECLGSLCQLESVAVERLRQRA